MLTMTMIPVSIHLPTWDPCAAELPGTCSASFVMRIKVHICCPGAIAGQGLCTKANLLGGVPTLRAAARIRAHPTSTQGRSRAGWAASRREALRPFPKDASHFMNGAFRNASKPRIVRSSSSANNAGSGDVKLKHDLPCIRAFSSFETPFSKSGRA